MAIKHILASITPPVLWGIARTVRRRVTRSTDHYEYAPRGWATQLPGGADSLDYWNTFIDRERALYEALVARVRQGRPLAEADGEALKHVTFGYVLAMAARGKPRLTVLDYGGNLGEYFWIGKALLPGVELEYHCKELPRIAETGRAINPDVIWHTDDHCLSQPYDLVMFSSSLQYVAEWRELLRLGALAARGQLFLSDTPCVRNVPAFVATERSGGATNLHWQLNHADVVSAVQGSGLRLVREFAMGAYPPVAHAPEQPRCAGWLFERP